MRQSWSALALVASLAACVGPPGGRRPSGQRPVQVIPQGQELKQCLSDLSHLKAHYSLLQDQNYGSGCSTISSVNLTSVGIPITNVSAIQCTLARALALWTREDVQPAARQIFGSPVVRLESFGSYSCRNIKGRPQMADTRSEHATANAVDISGFILADGRRITIENGWHGPNDQRRFLRAIHGAACNRFQTVLSPDFNAAHQDHLHFDLGRGSFCR